MNLTSLGLHRSKQVVLVVDESGTVVETSPAAAAMWGRGPKAVLGRKCYRLMNGRLRDDTAWCSEACTWLGPATDGSRGPTEIDVVAGSGENGRREYRVEHAELRPGGRRLIVHLLVEIGHAQHQERVGARLERLRAGVRLPIDPLTPREFEVFRLMSEGHNSVEIAAELGIRPATVRSHTARIFLKLGAGSRAGALMRYLVSELPDPTVTPEPRSHASRHGGPMTVAGAGPPRGETS